MNGNDIKTLLIRMVRCFKMMSFVFQMMHLYSK